MITRKSLTRLFLKPARTWTRQAFSPLIPLRLIHCHRLVYPGHPLPSFVLPPEDVNLLRIVHGSCRKPHGVGKEMLSALDTILASAIQQGKDRPQQLFLTGDQIYADDVAAPLLFALIDAGNFLFAGNEEEVLPGSISLLANWGQESAATSCATSHVYHDTLRKINCWR